MDSEKYTVASLKKQFKAFPQAKQHFGLKARSWQALADKLNSPSLEELKAQIVALKAQVARLEAENKQLRANATKNPDFDEIGFWLLDRNFDRAKFEDFGIPEEATEMDDFTIATLILLILLTPLTFIFRTTGVQKNSGDVLSKLIDSSFLMGNRVVGSYSVTSIETLLYGLTGVDIFSFTS